MSIEITVKGGIGSGKSALLAEFANWLRVKDVSFVLDDEVVKLEWQSPRLAKYGLPDKVFIKVIQTSGV